MHLRTWKSSISPQRPPESTSIMGGEKSWQEVAMRWMVVVAAGLAMALGSYWWGARGPRSYSTAYRRALAQRLSTPVVATPVTEDELAMLPGPVARYLRSSGVVGRPRTVRFRVVWEGRIRGGPGEAWMPFTAEQHNFVDEPARFFRMRARRAGLPVDVYHAFEGGAARMGARLLSLVQVMESSGPELTRAETVTLFNDLAIFAPSGLLGAAIRWEPIDERTARGHYTAGANTVSAVLHFNSSGELVDFVSDDRLAASSDGSTLSPVRWSTPLREYRDFEGRRHAGRGVGWWHPEKGPWQYFEGEVVAVESNPGPEDPGPVRRRGYDPDGPGSIGSAGDSAAESTAAESIAADAASPVSHHRGSDTKGPRMSTSTPRSSSLTA